MRRASRRRAIREASKTGRRARLTHLDLQPDALGVATRLAAVRLREAGVVLEPLLRSAGLSASQINGKDSRIVNAGVVLKCFEAGNLTITLRYAGVARHSDRQQMECLVTAIIRFCRDSTDRRLSPLAVHFVHRRLRQSSEIDKFFGCRIEFAANTDRIIFDKKAKQLR